MFSALSKSGSLVFKVIFMAFVEDNATMSSIPNFENHESNIINNSM